MLDVYAATTTTTGGSPSQPSSSQQHTTHSESFPSSEHSFFFVFVDRPTASSTQLSKDTRTRPPFCTRTNTRVYKWTPRNQPAQFPNSQLVSNSVRREKRSKKTPNLLRGLLAASDGGWPPEGLGINGWAGDRLPSLGHLNHYRKYRNETGSYCSERTANGNWTPMWLPWWGP